MVRWLRWHCPPDTGFEIRALAVWGRARYLSVTEAPHNTNFHTWMGKKQFCFFQTAETGNRTPDSGVKGSGANHYPRAPALYIHNLNLHLIRLEFEPNTSSFEPQPDQMSHRGWPSRSSNLTSVDVCRFWRIKNIMAVDPWQTYSNEAESDN